MCPSNLHESLGFGLGLRAEYYHLIETEKPTVDWFEIITEDYLVPGGRPTYHLEKIRQDYPIVMHGVSLSLGSLDPLDMDYLHQVKELAKKINACWVSDHLCWTGINRIYTHDLLPLPYIPETLAHLIPRIHQVQDYLGQSLVIENPSTYLSYRISEISEWDFITELVKATGCRVLLDINNIYVSAYNNGFDPLVYLNAIPENCVQQFHLAGHSNLGDLIVDTHDHRVIPNVWGLYEVALKRFGMVSTMIERDDRLPPFNHLLNELNKARKIANKCHLN
ncbi:MAG: hypothetical protein K0S08_102 [Gammaproteobacteria bacterium]|jgi:uncharacterized protein (UPF0276 family)|nr:hypothetical protein [Gammaproteobacteria bacterium]